MVDQVARVQVLVDLIKSRSSDGGSSGKSSGGGGPDQEQELRWWIKWQEIRCWWT